MHRGIEQPQGLGAITCKNEQTQLQSRPQESGGELAATGLERSPPEGQQRQGTDAKAQTHEATGGQVIQAILQQNKGAAPKQGHQHECGNSNGEAIPWVTPPFAILELLRYSFHELPVID